MASFLGLYLRSDHHWLRQATRKRSFMPIQSHMKQTSGWTQIYHRRSTLQTFLKHVFHNLVCHCFGVYTARWSGFACTHTWLSI